MKLGNQREPGTDRTHSSHQAGFGGRKEGRCMKYVVLAHGSPRHIPFGRSATRVPPLPPWR
ncbi:hypothetical protein LZ32DRAFT_572125 [Colletotrichum eremochloae]|nr:hypothetical protein LZ32DRAFT_572125 [Colletotrichum eremochloae]